MIPLPEEEGGANANDRTDGGNTGEELFTGAMVLSPPSTQGITPPYGLMQRNTVSVFVDFDAQTAVELDYQAQRWLFSPVRPVGYAVIDGELVALDLPSLDELWRMPHTLGSITFMRVADDGRSLIVADGIEGRVVDADTGTVRSTFDVGSPEDVAFVPGGETALVVGQTTWNNHQPSTPIVEVDLTTGDVVAIDIPNCAAPIEVLPSGRRALLSPTWCEEGAASTADRTWTNPDPVSVIELEAEGPRFNKNLPGFGPVALSEDGSRAVAYLDVQRLDPTMFDDPAQIPAADAKRFHLMVIDPTTLGFSLTEIGDTLPRFAMTRDGKGLLVDASVRVPRSKIEASADVSVDSDGVSVDVDLDIFLESTPFGYFDLDQLTFEPFAGSAGLDRFVMPASGDEVFTLTQDQLGGQLSRIDLDARSVVNLNTHLRDVGLLPDGETLVLRARQSPQQVEGGVHLQEAYYLSLDGVSYEVEIFFTSKLLYENEYCSNPENYHDC